MCPYGHTWLSSLGLGYVIIKLAVYPCVSVGTHMEGSNEASNGKGAEGFFFTGFYRGKLENLGNLRKTGSFLSPRNFIFIFYRGNL